MSRTDDHTASGARANGKTAPADKQNGSSSRRANPELGRRSEEIHRAYKESYQDLMSYAQGRIDSFESAQDIVQQAFTNTLAAVERGVNIHNAGGFLRRCVRNLCVDHTLAKQPLAIDDVICELQGESTVDSAELKLQCSAVSSALSGLTPDKRRAFILAEFKGLGCKEIAESMNCSTVAVWKLLSRARREIRVKVGAGSDWVGGSVPALGVNSVLEQDVYGALRNVFVSVKIKVAELSHLLGNVFQRGAEALQPNVSVAASVAAVALAAVSFPQLGKEDHTVTADSRGTGHVLSQPNKFVAGSRDRKEASVNIRRTSKPSKILIDNRKPASHTETTGRDVQKESRNTGDGHKEPAGNSNENSDPKIDTTAPSDAGNGDSNHGQGPRVVGDAALSPRPNEGVVHAPRSDTCNSTTPGACPRDDGDESGSGSGYEMAGPVERNEGAGVAPEDPPQAMSPPDTQPPPG